MALFLRGKGGGGGGLGSFGKILKSNGNNTCAQGSESSTNQGPVSRKPRKFFGPVKPFLDHLYLKTEKCLRLKLLV